MRHSLAAFLALLLFAAPAPAATPVELMQSALEAYFDGRYEDSIKLYEQVLELDRENAGARKGLKNAQAKREKEVKEQRALERKNLYAVEDFIKAGKLVEAYDRLQDILTRLPDHPDALKLNAKIRQRVERIQAKSKPESADWLEARGTLAHMDRDWFRAVESWERVVAFNAERIDLKIKIERAKKLLEEQERVDKMKVLSDLAQTNFTQGYYADARKAWEDLLAMDPGNEEAKTGIKKAARAQAEEIKGKQMEQVQDLQVRAMEAYTSGRVKDAAALFERVLTLDPSSILAQDYLERIRSGKRDPAGVVDLGGDAVAQAARFMDEDKFVEAIQALDRHLLEDPADMKADAMLQEAKTRQRTQADLAYKDGLTAYAQGLTNQAIYKWQEALRIDPDFVRAKQAIVKTKQEEQGE